MKTLFKFLGLSLITLIVVSVIYGVGIQYNWYGELEPPGVPINTPLSQDLVKNKIDSAYPAFYGNFGLRARSPRGAPEPQGALTVWGAQKCSCVPGRERACSDP